jgi:sugar phosphate isomerase/epimerase
MINIPVGLQLFSVRESLAKDFMGTLQQVAEIGYKNVEFAFHSTLGDGRFEVEYTSQQLKSKMESLGLQIVTSHVAYHPNLDWDAVIRYNAEIGSEGVVMPIAFFKDKQSVVELAQWLNESGRKCKEAGIQFYYHNHHHEFQQFDGEAAMDILLANTDPELVQLELDTFWALRGGVEPIAYMDKVGSRIGLLHQKDLSATASPVNMLESVTEPITMESFIGTINPADFTEIGTGVMDIPAILAKAHELGSVKYIIVEQDVTAKSELDSVKESFDNITKLLAQ